MLVIGLTGGIGTGKSFVASCFKRLHYPVFDADACVHELMAKNGKAVAAIKKVFPDAVKKGAVDRKELRSIVKKNEKELKKLEAILHPLVREEELRFLQKCRRLRVKLAVLEIPLLFESGADALCHVVVSTWVKPKHQERRVLKRPGMTKDFLTFIKKQQLEQQERVEKSDVVIDTSLSKAYSFSQVRKLISGLV